jgi:hypothetical protein
MAEIMASAAATSVMGTVIGKLAALLDKYKLAKDVERGIRFLQMELSSMDAVLRMLAEKDDNQIDPLAKDWRSKVTTSRIASTVSCSTTAIEVPRPTLCGRLCER